MKKLLISAGALGALALSTPAFAATSNTASSNATVNIVSPLTLINNNGLDFGTIVGPFSGEVVHVDGTGASDCATVGLTCSGTPTAASFTVTGTANQQLKLTIPNSVTLNRVGGGGSLSVDLSGDKPADPTLDATGSADFTVGGKLTLASGTTDGVYSNTFDVTADYQ